MLNSNHPCSTDQPNVTSRGIDLPVDPGSLYRPSVPARCDAPPIAADPQAEPSRSLCMRPDRTVASCMREIFGLVHLAPLVGSGALGANARRAGANARRRGANASPEGQTPAGQGQPHPPRGTYIKSGGARPSSDANTLATPAAPVSPAPHRNPSALITHKFNHLPSAPFAPARFPLATVSLLVTVPR
jgi:hypothetical protein